MRKLLAEAAGTFALVAVICAAAMMPLGAMEIGSRAFVIAIGAGISIAAMIYAAGAVSGGHFNPAVTCGLCAAGRFPGASVVSYVAAQVVGATLAALAIYVLLSNQIGWSPKGFASNGFAAHSPGDYPANSAFAAEAVFSAILVVVYCRTIHHKNSARLIAPLMIGITFAVLYYLAIPITNASLNPARSTATALFAEAWAINQLWMFWLAPLLGGVAGGVADRIINSSRV